MSRIVIPKEVLEATLRGLKDEVEFVDESGEVLGHFLPTKWERVFDPPLLSDEELARLGNEPGGGRTLAEIMCDLEKLAS